MLPSLPLLCFPAVSALPDASPLGSGRTRSATDLTSSHKRTLSRPRSRRLLLSRASSQPTSSRARSNGSTSAFLPFLVLSLLRTDPFSLIRHLGIDATYFQREEPAVIAEHIMALFVLSPPTSSLRPADHMLPPPSSLSFSYGAKILAFTKHSADKLQIDLERIQPEEEGKKEGTCCATTPWTLMSFPSCPMLTLHSVYLFCKPTGAIFIHTSEAGKTSREGPGATVEGRCVPLFCASPEAF